MVQSTPFNAFISGLPTATSVNKTDLMYVEQGGTSKQAAVSKVINSVVPTGGAAGLVLTKNSSADFDVSWKYGAGIFQNVLDFGAVGNGTTDDTTAIQAAINALPATGGVVLFPALNYKISSTLTIGNGSASAASTISGVMLQGIGNPTTCLLGGITVPVGPKLTWAGGASDMIQILGPLTGWGVQNMMLNGASTANRGIKVVSAQYGDCRNLTVIDCIVIGIESTTVSSLPAGVANADALHNSYQNIAIVVPNVASAIGASLNCTGSTSDTDYNDWNNVFIQLRNGSNATTGFYVGAADTCFLRGFHFSSLGGATSNSTAVTLDYTSPFGAFTPAANMFFGIDTGGSAGLIGHQWKQIGNPGVGVVANLLFGIGQANNARGPNISGVSFPPLTQASNATGQTFYLVSGGPGPLAATNLFVNASGGAGAGAATMIQINWYLNLTATGTGGNFQVQFSWNDPVHSQTVSETPTLDATVANGYISGARTMIISGSSNLATVAVLANSITGSPTFQLGATVEVTALFPL